MSRWSGTRDGGGLLVSKPHSLGALPRLLVVIATLLWLSAAPPAAAHHVGTYTPRDNEISTNFKQLKFSIQARKFDVALRLFEAGALRKEMRAQAARLPAGLEESTRAALKAGDGPGAERHLMLFFAALIRDLALEAERQVTEPGEAIEARAAAGRRFLEAIWRYYNLIDFVVSQHHNTAAATIRLAFDEAEGYVKGSAAPTAANPCVGPKARAGAGAGTLAPDKMREPLRRIAQTLSSVIEGSSPSTRRES
ncbi:MAG: hypothetical protein HY727_10900 [Candidatus Rokubacteria bacterium]|nr:hypothetical protein [Candidatus Rokubacteria bacterium]